MKFGVLVYAPMIAGKVNFLEAALGLRAVRFLKSSRATPGLQTSERHSTWSGHQASLLVILKPAG